MRDLRWSVDVAIDVCGPEYAKDMKRYICEIDFVRFSPFPGRASGVSVRYSLYSSLDHKLLVVKRGKKRGYRYMTADLNQTIVNVTLY